MEKTYVRFKTNEQWTKLVHRFKEEKKKRILYKYCSLILLFSLISTLAVIISTTIAEKAEAKTYVEEMTEEMNRYHPYVVREGDTLQKIAKLYCGSSSWKEYMQEIIAVNKIVGDRIIAGETIRIGY